MTSPKLGLVLLCGDKPTNNFWIYALQIKQAITGYGRADKHQMQEMVRVILKLNEVPKPDDCADA